MSERRCAVCDGHIESDDGAQRFCGDVCERIDAEQGGASSAVWRTPSGRLLRDHQPPFQDKFGWGTLAAPPSGEQGEGT